MASTTAGGGPPSSKEDALATMIDMGHSKELAEQALEENDGCVDSAIDALFMGRVGKKKKSSKSNTPSSEEEEEEVSDGAIDSEGNEEPRVFDGSAAWGVTDDSPVAVDETTVDEEAPPVKEKKVEDQPNPATQDKNSEVVDESTEAIVEESEPANDVEAPPQKDEQEDSKQVPGESPNDATQLAVAAVPPVLVDEVVEKVPKPSASLQTEDLLVDVAADDDEVEFTGDVEEQQLADTADNEEREANEPSIQSKDLLVDVAADDDEVEIADGDVEEPKLVKKDEEDDVKAMPVPTASARKTSSVQTSVASAMAASRKSQPRSTKQPPSSTTSNKQAPPEAAVAADAAVQPDEEAPLTRDAKPSDTPTESGNWWSKSTDKKKKFIVLGGLAALLVLILAISIPVSRNNNNSDASPSSEPAPSSPGVGGEGPLPTSDSSGPPPEPQPTTDARSREGIAEMLSSISSDGGIALNTKDSAQDLALTWLMTNAKLAEYSDAKLVQRYTLATLFYATNGPLWKDKWGWLTDADECSPDGWFQSKGALEETLCNEEGKLVHLKLIFNRVNGVLPAELGLLGDSLEVLDFASNTLEGPIFSTIGNLTGLHTLVLSGNQLTGNIPAAIGQLTNLERLWLYGNKLSGPIPAEIGALVNLKQLSLVWNTLSSRIPNTVGLMTSLEELWLYENDLSGPIPVEITTLTGLERLWLYSNNLTGSIPESIGNMTALADLRLHNNTLGGRIPSVLNDMPNLNSLWLYDNNFGGSFECDDSIDLCFIRCADFESFRDRCRKW